MDGPPRSIDAFQTKTGSRMTTPRTTFTSHGGTYRIEQDGTFIDLARQVGLYLPQTAVDARQAQGGRVVALGPGIPVASLDQTDDEPRDKSTRIERHRITH